MNQNFIKIYADFLKNFLKPAKPLKVIFDCSNGTTGLILQQLLKAKTPASPTGKYKLKALLINNIPDGNFPGHGPNPLAKNATNRLKKEIIKQKANLGVIFDADGDRAFFINNKGKFINPDIIANLLIWHLKPKKVVIDVRTGWLIKKCQLPSAKYRVSKVGHYFIKKLMRKINADFGAEQSGHYYFARRSFSAGELFYFDSGILAAIETINAISKLPYSLADFANLAPQYYQSGEINIKMNNKLRIMNYEYLFKKIENYYQLNPKPHTLVAKNHLDGLIMEFSDWWFNLRPSNTEPLIRLNIETTNKNLLDKSIKKLYSLIRN